MPVPGGFEDRTEHAAVSYGIQVGVVCGVGSPWIGTYFDEGNTVQFLFTGHPHFVHAC